eukprot:287971-Amphidinium_carterae.1
MHRSAVAHVTDILEFVRKGTHPDHSCTPLEVKTLRTHTANNDKLPLICRLGCYTVSRPPYLCFHVHYLWLASCLKPCPRVSMQTRTLMLLSVYSWKECP